LAVHVYHSLCGSRQYYGSLHSIRNSYKCSNYLLLVHQNSPGRTPWHCSNQADKLEATNSVDTSGRNTTCHGEDEKRKQCRKPKNPTGKPSAIAERQNILFRGLRYARA